MRLFIIFIILVFVVLSVRLLYIYFWFNIDNKYNDTKSKYLYERRASIVDRNGVILARDTDAYDVYISLSKAFKLEEDLKKMQDIFPDIESRIPNILEEYERWKSSKFNSNNSNKNRSKLVIIKKSITPKQRDQILDQGIIGVEFEESKRRAYIHDSLTSHVLGFTSSDNIGLSGVELSFNNYLSDPKNNPLVLSLDIEMQRVVRRGLDELMNKYNAKGAFGIIMNVKTGELISAVSLPDFNPNLSHNYTKEQIFNRFSLGVYELGSVFKVLFGGFAVKEGLSMTKKYNIDKTLEVDDFKIKNFKYLRDRQALTIPEMIKYSSNIGCGTVAKDMNVLSYKNFFKKMGFNDRIGVELKERGYPIFPNNWTKTTMITASYGHGIAVTPLHFTVGLGALLNNGVVIEPTILKNKRLEDIRSRGYVFSKHESEILRDMLRKIEQDSLITSDIRYYDVNSKSGTAIMAKNGIYDRDAMLLSFVISGPMEDPEYVFYFGLQEPSLHKIGGSRFGTGGRIVGPIVAKIVKNLGPALGIKIYHKQVSK